MTADKIKLQRKILELFDKHLAEENCTHTFEDLEKEVSLS